jgi:hypothetical protein
MVEEVVVAVHGLLGLPVVVRVTLEVVVVPVIKIHH